MNDKLAACVVLYNPDKNVIKNIESYIKSVDILYIVDNCCGGAVSEFLQKNYDNIVLKKYKENKGLAYPYNQILNEIYGNYKFLLLMDQDSSFYNNNFMKYKNLINDLQWENILALGCNLVNFNYNIDNDHVKIFVKQVDRLINSGTIINVDLAKKIGGWNEELFIDAVDDEFCYRGRIENYKILQCNESICLKHLIGEPIKKKILFKTFYSMNHNYIRKYYMIRNGLYVWKKYHNLDNKKFFKDYLKANWNMIFEIFLVEDDKFRKLKYCYFGIRDFLNSKMGKLNYK